jgi:type II secretory ATPase GspE/PulE/Tfp pilus assembly ATPase PilB-like protein
MRNFVGIEDEAKPEREIENIPITHYDSRKSETPMDLLPKLNRTYPDVYVLRDFVNGETVDTLCDQVTVEQRFVFASTRAKEATEALLRGLMLKATPDKFAQAITAVLNVRLVRKLCDKCKEAYAPPAEVLKQLGLPPGKVQALYRPPVPPPPDSEAAKNYKPCDECMAIGYRGRTAIFELVIVDDRMRQLLAKQPKLELLRDASRKAGNRNLQEEGVLLVARGITSVPELVRVLKL